MGRYGTEPNLVEVYSASHVQADVVRSVLEGSGIPAVVKDEGSAAYPLTVGAMGEGKVLVRQEDRDRALDVIRGTTEEAAAAERIDDGSSGRRPLWILVVAVIILVLAVHGVLVDGGPTLF